MMFVWEDTKVNFFIETSSTNISANLESLILEVYTNGSITPTEAVSTAAEILQTIFGSLKLTELPRQAQTIIDGEFQWLH